MEQDEKPSAQIIEFRLKKKEPPCLIGEMGLMALEGLTEYASNKAGFTPESIQKIICQNYEIQSYAEIDSQELYDLIVSSLFRSIDISRGARPSIRSARQARDRYLERKKLTQAKKSKSHNSV